MLIKEKLIAWYKRTLPKLLIVLSFPSVWLFCLLVISSIVCLIIAYFFNENNPFLSSVLSNIFAGLVTGLVISALSGVKQVYIAKLICKKEWLQTICDAYIEYKNQFMGNPTRDMDILDYMDYIDDILVIVSDINSHITQSQFDKRLLFDGYEYVKKKYNYDSVEQAKYTGDLRVYLSDEKNVGGKRLRELFREQSNRLKALQRMILDDIRDINMHLEHSKNVII